MLIREAIDDFLSISEAKGLSHYTVSSRKGILHAFSDWAPDSSPCLDNYDVTEITPGIVSEYLVHLRHREGRWPDSQGKPRAPGRLQESTIQAHLRVLKTFFNWLHRRLRRKGIDNVENPVADIPQRKYAPDIPQALTLEEVVATSFWAKEAA